jgi:hypothetical protein
MTIKELQDNFDEAEYRRLKLEAIRTMLEALFKQS